MTENELTVLEYFLEGNEQLGAKEIFENENKSYQIWFGELEIIIDKLKRSGYLINEGRIGVVTPQGKIALKKFKEENRQTKIKELVIENLYNEQLKQTTYHNKPWYKFLGLFSIIIGITGGVIGIVGGIFGARALIKTNNKIPHRPVTKTELKQYVDSTRKDMLDYIYSDSAIVNPSKK